MGCLHTLWDITEASFRVLVQPAFGTLLRGAVTNDDLRDEEVPES